MAKRNLPFEDNPRSIKYYVKRLLMAERSFFEGKRVIDFPAGNGVTSRLLQEVKAIPLPMDLFPEYFETEGLTCERANIKEGLPVADASADVLICQEGIEHFSDQLEALREFNRVLVPGGKMLITTPNYSNLVARLSYGLAESERHTSFMPPNELDSIWMSKQELTAEIYFGHIFLIGIQKLRVLAKLAGFQIETWYPTKPKRSAKILYLFGYPWIYLFNRMLYRKNMRKNQRFGEAMKRSIYEEQFRLSTDRKLLVGSHLMVMFIKEKELHEVGPALSSKQDTFGVT
ncbi:MAG: class I SAM-dependent methyltransferase [Bacteroidota bacterium]